MQRNPFKRAFLIILLLILSFVILKWKRENDGEEYVLEPRRRSNRFSDGSRELDDLVELVDAGQPQPRRSRFWKKKSKNQLFSFKNTSVLSTKSVRFSTTSQVNNYYRNYTKRVLDVLVSKRSESRGLSWPKSAKSCRRLWRSPRRGAKKEVTDKTYELNSMSTLSKCHSLMIFK